MSPDPKESRELGRYFALSQVGVEMVVPIIVGLLLDQWLGTVPWLMLGGIVLGLVGGLIHMLLILKKLDRSDSGPPEQGPT